MTTFNRNEVFNGTGTGAGVAFTPYTDETSTIRYQIVLATTGTVGFEHMVDGTTWVPIAAVNENTGVAATSATASGIYTINASASYQVRPNVSANGTGMVITGTIVKGAPGISAATMQLIVTNTTP